jgi:hypothetical protein
MWKRTWRIVPAITGRKKTGLPTERILAGAEGHNRSCGTTFARKWVSETSPENQPGGTALRESVIYRHGWSEANQKAEEGLPEKMPVLRVQARSRAAAVLLAE